MNNSLKTGFSNPFRTLMKGIFFIIFIDLLISLLWSTFIINKVEEFEHPDTFDAVVVLMGDFNEDFTAVGPRTLRRLNFALLLRNEMQITHFLCVGGSRPTKNIVGADLMKNYLHEHGIPTEQLYSAGHSFDTRSNWTDILNRIQTNNWKSVGVISSAFHLYRFHNHIANHNNNFQLSLLPYPYMSSNPKTTLSDLWVSIHYEWITYLLYALPEPIYSQVISLIRPQKVVSNNS